MPPDPARLVELAEQLRAIAAELASDKVAPHAGVLPPEWVPSSRMIEGAVTKYPGLDVVNETDKFRHHHFARRTRYLDWDDAWWGWLAKSAEFQRRDSRTQRSTTTATRAQQTSRENRRRIDEALARFDEVPDPDPSGSG